MARLRFHAFTVRRALPLSCTASFSQDAGGCADVEETSRLCKGAQMQAAGARVGEATMPLSMRVGEAMMPQ
jgi:hypothetical protein